jgi:hypothetical protein
MLLLLAGLLLFHQPLLTAALRQIAIRVAARENVRLELEVHGSVWTRLTIKNLKATPTGSSPIDSITIEELQAEYSLPTLLRRGVRDFLTGYHLHNANLVLDAVRSNEDQKHKLAHVLHDILQQPAMYSDRAWIENFNLTLRTPEGTYRWQGVKALLDPVQPGYVRIASMEIPRVGSWRDLHSTATYVNRHLVMRNFNLGEEAQVARLELDASLRSKGVVYLSFEGTVLGADLGLFLWQRESAGDQVQAQLTASLSGLSLERFGKRIGSQTPVSGRLTRAWVQVAGDPRHPANWEGQTTVAIENAVWGGFHLGEIAGKATLAGKIAKLESFQFTAGSNHLLFSGEWPLPHSFDRAHLPAMEAAFALNAPDLPRLHAAFTGGHVNGQGRVALQKEIISLEGQVNAAQVQGRDFGVENGRSEIQLSHPLRLPKPGAHWGEALSGHALLNAKSLRFHEFAARSLSFDLPVTGTTVQIERFALDLNGKDQVRGEASLSCKKPFAYEARLDGQVQNLAVFQPFVTFPLSGSLQLNWHGTGEIDRMRHTGEGQVALSQGRIGSFTGVTGALAGIYSPESIDLTQLRLVSDQGTFQAGVRMRDQRLRIEQLRLTAGKDGVLTGNLTLPLDLRTPTRPETVIPESGRLEGELVLAQIDLAKAVLVPNLALSGTLDGSLTTGGTVGSPEFNVKIQARNLQSPSAAKLVPAAGSAMLLLSQNRLALTGTLAQPGLSPLWFKAGMPLNLRTVLIQRRIDPSTPFTASVKLPPSSAAIFGPLIPGVRFLEGRLSIDASASGTLEKPVFNGGVALDLPAIRFRSANLPGINHFLGDLRFSGTELTFRRFSGDMAGGPFSATGVIRLDPLADPLLDLRFQSQGTLLARNDTLTLRADSDLRLQGPLNSARVTGKVGINKSRFFREIEILPLGLPGRPAPKMRRGEFQFATETRPFSLWSFDVAVRTAEPFLVKGNLANGAIEGNLHLGGTGLAPTLEGTARIENFVASLPFSRLSVDHGALYFSGNQPLNPTLDVHGSSRIRDYNVNVYLYGTASEPQTVFTSEPSLPQEEIMALLATGATTRDFAQNNQAMAGRAAVLLFQDLYRKIRPNRPPPDDNTHNPMDRFSLDVGSVDPRTGKQELMGKFKLSNQYEVGAGVDMQGDVRMQLRYLLRFK